MSRRKRVLPTAPAHVREYRERQIADLKKRVSHTLRPIVLQHLTTAIPAAGGSCVLLRIGDQRFLVSAAHVLRPSKSHRLLTWTKTGFVDLSVQLIRGQLITTWEPGLYDLRDPFDLALLPFPKSSFSEFTDDDFLPLAHVDRDEVNSADGIYVAFGFPEGVASYEAIGRHIDLRWITSAGVGRPAVLKELKLSTDTHIAVEFDRFNSVAREGISKPFRNPAV